MGDDMSGKTSTARCDPEALVQLLDGALDGAARESVQAHLRGCEACQRQVRWLGRVEGLLGPLHEGHPPSSTLTAYAAGELAAEQRRALAAHLEGCDACRRLERAAAAGLQEAEQVERDFVAATGVRLVVVDAAARFLDALAGVSDPEAKRKIIGREFIRAFEAAAREIVAEVREEAGADPDEEVRFLVQGTLYPDVVESGGGEGAANIKSHHNVGGLPDDLAFCDFTLGHRRFNNILFSKNYITVTLYT